MTRTLTLASFLLTALIGFGQTASAAPQSLENFLPDYLKLHTALVTDSLDQVHEAAGALAQSAKSVTKVKAAATKIQKAKTLETARSEFKALSGPFVEWAEKAKPSGISVMYCSMVKTKWVQKDGTVMNPYYGAEMRNCGEKL